MNCLIRRESVHSSKILTIQQGQPRGVSSIGNPRQASTGFNSGSLMAEISTEFYPGRLSMAYLIYQPSIFHKGCRGLTKCWGSMFHLVVLSEFCKSLGYMQGLNTNIYDLINFTQTWLSQMIYRKTCFTSHTLPYMQNLHTHRLPIMSASIWQALNHNK